MSATGHTFGQLAFHNVIPVKFRAHVVRSCSAFAPTRLRMTIAADGRKVLLINTKGGGHAVIGPHLAESLLSAGHIVHVLQVGPESVKGPFARYSALSSSHPDRFSVSYGDVSPKTVPSGEYDAVYDNNAKDVADVHAVIEAGKAGAEVFYVSSAGAYSYDAALAPHISGDKAKGPTIDVENALRESGVSSACFRPIYIIGPGSAKREYTDFFFDRIVRGRPLPIPGTGAEFTSITDVRDVASMLAAAVGKGLSNEILNSVSTRAVTFAGIVKMCEKTTGKKANVVWYDPARIEKSIEGFKVKNAFPFRPRHFFADPFGSPHVHEKLSWDALFSGSQASIQSAVDEAYASYIEQGLDKKVIDFTADDAILAAALS